MYIYMHGIGSSEEEDASFDDNSDDSEGKESNTRKWKARSRERKTRPRERKAAKRTKKTSKVPTTSVSSSFTVSDILAAWMDTTDYGASFRALTEEQQKKRIGPD